MNRSEHIPNLALHDGYVIPALGFGTYRLNGHLGVQTMQRALAHGYRMLDSAFNYENEGAVGQAARLSGLQRDELFIASKLPGRHHAYDKAIVTIEESLYRAQLNYFDLYLIHWPLIGRYDFFFDYLPSWAAVICWLVAFILVSMLLNKIVKPISAWVDKIAK